MNINLKPEEEKIIQAKLETGKYATPYQVIVEALQLLEERDKHYEQWVEETRKKVAIGIAQLDRGEGINGEIAIANLREKLRKARENQA
ncbi:type II toxin-antitoxin system ParD family antitoxin [Calothrix sp. FACHB-1219]|uniref:ribbon-helix-helix domain-containing protein n=1 Tax=unclassified Calothrix TaxID=2619626 RepID=UPI001685E9BF|nr:MULTISPECIES: type II toxin-antitoxin system ParD family antitoxin [unclassified Calothrix]MBD2203351.1 type II toxin-antitoxin system ParD family antitoxin [Calothrix sp. FACHB-168]MBD2216352.1 type II toxin-antitoxin system ParD family antitoxin [Calothrix sp. FACHB-1219]